MKKCKKCGKELNFLETKKTCADERDIDYWCSDCAKSELKECKYCDGLFCQQHLTTHDCYEDYSQTVIYLIGNSDSIGFDDEDGKIYEKIKKAITESQKTIEISNNLFVIDNICLVARE
jgi:hypothetical protein